MRIKDGGDKYWQRKGVIKEKVAPRSYIVESEAGVHYRRNRQDILKTNENLNIQLNPNNRLGGIH